MKIARISVRNFLGISSFDTTLKDGINHVEGANGSGKSSLIKAIQKVLRGGRADGAWVIHRLRNGGGFVGAEAQADDHDEPTVAEILVELDGALTVNRRITRKGTDVTVTPKDGVPIKAPQSYLDSIVSPHSLNPVEFFNAPAAERRKILLSLVPPLLNREDLGALLLQHGLQAPEIQEVLGSLEKIGLEELSALDETIMIRRQAAWAKKEHHGEAQVAEIVKLPVGYDGTKPLPDFQDIMARLDAANATTAGVTAARHSLAGIVRERDRAQQDVERARRDMDQAVQRGNEEAARIRQEIARLTAELELVRVSIDNASVAGAQSVKHAEGELGALELRVTDAQEKLNAATAAAIDPAPIKDEAARYQQERTWRAAYEAAFHHHDEREQFADAVRRYDAANQQGIRIEAPKLLWSRLDHTPLRGLDLGMEGDRITVRGVDIDNLSTSEQIRVALAIARSTASAGEIQTICIDGFEALDPTTRAAFREAAKDDGFQYVIAEVADGPLRVNGGAS